MGSTEFLAPLMVMRPFSGSLLETKKLAMLKHLLRFPAMP